MGIFYSKNGGGGDSGLSPETSEFLKHWTYDEETRHGKFDGSIEVLPSTFYMGEFSLSNGVQAVAFTLADGTKALGLVNRFNPQLGTISNPKFFALGAQTTLAVNTISTGIIPDGFTLQYTTAGNNLTFDFDFIPATAGMFKAEYWIGTNDSGNKIFDEVRTVTQAEVDAGNPIPFTVGNPYLLEVGTNLFVRFTGIDFKGNAETGLPYFVSKILPYKEITVNGHVECVTANQTLYIGCDYAVDTSEGAKTITVPLAFTNKFVVYDYKGTITSTNKVIINFSAHGQSNFEMIHKDDYCEFFYIAGDGWYVSDIKGAQVGRVG